jgi:c-di-GMP-binding flagellar brake protein YcgR
MKPEFKERRKYRRVLFSIDQGLSGQITLESRKSKTSQPLVAPVLDISEGGIGFVLDPSFEEEIKINDQLKLTQLTICVDDQKRVYPLETHQPMMVRGKIKADFLSHIGVGCDFTGITSDIWSEIKDFIKETYPNSIL